MTELRLALSGNVPALVTPLSADAESLDVPALRRLIAEQRAAGSRALTVLGTAGEGPVLTEATASAVLDLACAESDVPIVCGISGNSVAAAVASCRWALEHGAAAVLLTPPTYYRMGPATVTHFLSEVAEKSSLPVVVDHMPGLTKTSLGLDALVGLARHPNVAGVVEGSGDLSLLADLVAAGPDETPVLVARAPLLLPALAVGARGLLSPAGGCAPGLVVALLDAWERGDLRGARESQRRLTALAAVLHSTRVPTNVNVKVLLADSGVIGSAASPAPYGGLAPDEQRVLLESARRLDVSLRDGVLDAG